MKLKLLKIESSEWSKIKKKNRADTFLIVANGPSLKLSDIEKLGHKMPTIASNKIYLFFDMTKWRPTFLTICDTLLAYKLRKFDFRGVSKVFCSDEIFFMLRGAKRKLAWKNITLLEAWSNYEKKKCFSPDPVNPGFYEGLSITNQNIQLAIWLGARRIYIIGLDHFYDEKVSEKAGTKLTHKGKNHFHSDYRKEGEIVNNAPIMKMNDAYAKTHAIGLANGVEIINISRSTNLNVFPKSTVESVLNSI